jgi:hypothetical protein
MANAFMTGNTGGNALASDAPLGTGLVRGAVDVIKLREEWQRLYTDGDTNLQFKDWLAAQGISNPVMPR